MYLSEREKEEAQKKMEAWMRVARLCVEAEAALMAVNEGQFEQPSLSWIAEKARIQAQLWNV